MRKLTKREQGYIKDVTKGESKRQAVLNNYDVKNLDGAGSMADAIEKRPEVKKKLQSIADAIPDELLIKKHLELLNSTIGENDKIDVQGVKAGLDMAYKIKSTYAPEKTESKVTIETMSQEEKEALLNLLK
jgi:hypothetical protein